MLGFTRRVALQFCIITTVTRVGLSTDIFRRKCLKTHRKQYSIERLDNWKDQGGPPVCGYFPPAAPSLDGLDFKCNKGAVVLSWTAKIDNRLGGFLIRVKKNIDGPKTSIHYLLVNVTHLQVNVTGKQKRFKESFSYRCIDIKHSHKVEIEIWSMSRDMKKCDSVFRSLVTDRNELQSRCDAEMCLCKSTVVAIKSYIHKEDNSLNGIITLANTPAGTGIRILLLQDNGTVLQNWTTTWQANKTDIRVQAEHIPPGTYFFKVIRYCKHKPSMRTTCGVSQTPAIRSKAIKVPARVGEEQRRTRSVDASLVLLIIFVSLIVILLVVFIWLVISRLGLLTGCTKRQPNRFINARRIYHQIQEADGRKRVALIFAKDSSAHCKRVHRLKTELYNSGLEAVAIDEQTNAEMMVNWIDVGERIPSQFDILLFVMSPILYELCHRDGTGILEVARDGHTVHRLPAAVLHALRVKPYYKDAKVPRAFVVSLDRVAKESNPMIKSFLKEFKSVFHPKPIFVNDMCNGLKHLLKTIHARSPFVV